eukprot:SAG11_NODE_751_length_7356_cov_33.908227_6_plen_144_part_00
MGAKNREISIFTRDIPDETLKVVDLIAKARISTVRIHFFRVVPFEPEILVETFRDQNIGLVPLVSDFVRGHFSVIFEVERLGRLGSTGTRGCPTDALIYILLDARGVNKRLGVEVVRSNLWCLFLVARVSTSCEREDLAHLHA